ncbi:MAG: hypothetical protein PWR27_793 [Petroclostridium sp.]|jgi:hypothetical protein|nr:hypothetical protein [Petroclostridium xylanilyticum]MBZ4644989.1 hypothetical protein [Clostridia bacterium]MDK2810084.1 hypothetical protein [Petroclostridium sp.]
MKTKKNDKKNITRQVFPWSVNIPIWEEESEEPMDELEELRERNER